MGNSIFFAKLLGPYFLIVAIGLMLNMKLYQKVMGDFVKNTALIYIGGVMALLFGLIVVLLHNVWAVSWALIITIVGWLGIIKGTWLIVFPGTVGKFTGGYLKKKGHLLPHAIVVGILGVALTVMGYFVR
ncbi:hypothetical protein ACFL3J_01330 [Candidatus Omnitrophota bacterium]